MLDLKDVLVENAPLTKKVLYQFFSSVTLHFHTTVIIKGCSPNLKMLCDDKDIEKVHELRKTTKMIRYMALINVTNY